MGPMRRVRCPDCAKLRRVIDIRSHIVDGMAWFGALALVGIVVFRNFGENEGGDVILVLGPLAAVVGAFLGGCLGLLIRQVHWARQRRTGRAR